jgi:hypothetical protein
MWTPNPAALALSFMLPIQVVNAQEYPKCLRGKAATQGLGDNLKALQAALEDPITRLCEHDPNS